MENFRCKRRRALSLKRVVPRNQKFKSFLPETDRFRSRRNALHSENFIKRIDQSLKVDRDTTNLLLFSDIVHRIVLRIIKTTIIATVARVISADCSALPRNRRLFERLRWSLERNKTRVIYLLASQLDYITNRLSPLATGSRVTRKTDEGCLRRQNAELDNKRNFGTRSS